MEALREIRGRGITCSISSVIMRQTIDRLSEVVDLAAKLAIPVISMQPYQRETAGIDKDHFLFEFRPEEEDNLGKKLRRLVTYAEQKKVIVHTASMMKYVPVYLTRGVRYIPPLGCYVPSRTMIVDSAGECFSCFQRLDSRKHESMGNAHKQTLNEIWHNDVHSEQVMSALNRKCPGCLSSCSDIESFNALAQKGWLSGQPARILSRLVRGPI